MIPSKPRGRPRSFDREAALQTATLLFWEHGYEGTSIADLTAAIGVTPPTLYAAFGSKDQLYAKVLSHYILQGGMAEGAMSTDTSARAAIEGYLRSAADRFTDSGRPAGCLISTASLTCAAENDAARTVAAALRAQAFALLIAKLEWAQSTGELPASVDPQALARFYSAIVQGMSVQAIDGASATALHGLVDLALMAWPA